MRISLMAAVAVWSVASGAWGQATGVPVKLLCEYRPNPVVDVGVPRLSWQLSSGQSGALQTGYQVVAASTAEKLAADQGDLWDSGRRSGGETLQMAWGGKPLVAGQQVYWKVKEWMPKQPMVGGVNLDDPDEPTAWSAAAHFSVGPQTAADWRGTWIGYPADDGDKVSEPAPCFRKEFSLGRPVTRATVHICGLGQYELTLNGKKVGDAVLTPAWTSYRKTCAYDSYDVTGQVKQGGNALGVMLGNGMYNVLRVAGRYTKFSGSMGVPKVIGQLEVEYADGTREVIGTDETWKAARGPVTFSHTYGGEDYDARKEMPGWDSAGFADGAWAAAVRVAAPGAEGASAQLVAAVNPPIKVEKVYPAAKVTRVGNAWVIDFGQNLSGWPHLKVTGAAGSVVRMTPGELLGANGMLTQGGSGGPMWFSYTLKGSGVEEWRPRFSYYGYRYLQITGAVPPGQVLASADAALPKIEEISSEFVHADVSVVGKFESSDPLLNRIHTLINMAILSNTQSVLTDCPHREKLGWLEQSHLVFDGIAMNYDVSGLYTKICRDMRDAQTASGLVPDIAPEYTTFSGGFRDSPEWGSAAVIDPWDVYQTYGDRRILAEQYETMKKYVAYLGSRATGDIVAHGLGDWYDIGPRKPGNAQLTSTGLTSTAMYDTDIEILRRAAEILGKLEDVKKFAEDAVRVKAAFNAKFYDAAGEQYEKGSQTALAMPLALGLVDPGKREAIARKLEESVRGNQYKVTAGDVGFSYVVKALTDTGGGETMLKMMLQADGPGYVMQLNKGATTLTEAWDAQASSSQNHLMLGHAEAWLYRGLAGIQNDPEGRDGGAFKHFIVHPQMVGTLTSVSAEYESPRGLIKSGWKRSGVEGKQLAMRVTVPANTTATVYVPAADEGAVKVRVEPFLGPSVISMGAAKFARMENGEAVYTVGSGNYEFSCTMR